MKVLLQHRHAPREISGVRSYLQTLAKALDEIGIKADVVSTHHLGFTELVALPARYEIVHLNSHHLLLLLAARRHRRPVILKVHYPYWGELMFMKGPVLSRSLSARLLREFRFRWEQGQGAGLTLGRVRYASEMWSRAALRVATALLADRLLAPSAYQAAAIDLPRPIAVAHYPLPLELVTGQRSPSSAQARRFVFVGSLTWRKGPDILLRAARMCRDHDLACQVDFVGAGEMEAELRQLSERLGLTGCVTFHGHRPRHEVLEVMRDSLALVTPSRINDPAPNVVIEAASVWCPCIGSLRGGIPELAGDAGLLFDPDDAGELARHMMRLLKDPAEAFQRGRRAAEIARAQFDPRAAATKFAELCQSLAAGAAGSTT